MPSLTNLLPDLTGAHSEALHMCIVGRQSQLIHCMSSYACQTHHLGCLAQLERLAHHVGSVLLTRWRAHYSWSAVLPRLWQTLQCLDVSYQIGVGVRCVAPRLRFRHRPITNSGKLVHADRSQWRLYHNGRGLSAVIHFYWRYMPCTSKCESAACQTFSVCANSLCVP